MPTRQVHLPVPSARVAQALERLRAELDIPVDHPPAALAEAERAAARPAVDLPDARDLPLVTIDPPGARDLDQAVHIEEDGEGFVVHYAIADVAGFVTPGSALDDAVRARGVTVYGPTGSTPLHPEVLSAGAASLLPGEDRPSYLWRIALDPTGTVRDAVVRRALVRSRAQLTYEQVQRAVDGAGDDRAVPPTLPRLLQRVGQLRLAQEHARGGVSLEIPEQEVVQRDGGYALRFRATLPVEEWNAQVSLLTGISAAAIMRDAGVGILRTLPEADPRDLARLRRTARALGIEWPAERSYQDLVPTLDSALPGHAAFLANATTLFRGADYAVIDAAGDGQGAQHAAIAAHYAHVTAPLRRLVDRYALEVCRALCADEPVPSWVLDALPELPRTMARTTQRAGRYERGAVDAVEALVLEGRVGEEFRAVVVDVDDDGARGTAVIAEPAVEAKVRAQRLPLGEEIGVRLEEVDVAARSVHFSAV